MCLSLPSTPEFIPRTLSRPAREGSVRAAGTAGLSPGERPRTGESVRKEKRSLFERSDFRRFPQTRRPAGETAFHGAVFFAPPFPGGGKWGIAGFLFLAIPQKI